MIQRKQRYNNSEGGKPKLNAEKMSFPFSSPVSSFMSMSISLELLTFSVL